MDRKAFKLPFTKGRAPDWMCPSCSKGVLRIKDTSFFTDERALSRDHSYEAWEPEWITNVYSCLLYCTNDKCKEVVASSGSGGVDWSVCEHEHGEPEQVYEDYFHPKYFDPPLRLITVPSSCPENVSIPIEESFRLFFASPSAAANGIRISIEQLLTELKIKRFNLMKGKRRFISLHQRIALLPPQHSEIRDLILAIKWLGNSGSHSRGNMTRDDVMDAYELFEHILEEIYGKKAKKLKALAKKVNKKKGPVK
ncbi:MAG: DUF4145 domain-containing protein [Nitrospirota bacterium]